MNKVFQRLLVFFIGVPLIILLVFFESYNHLPLQIAVMIAILIATHELYTILKQKIHVQPLWIPMGLNFIISIINLCVWSCGITAKWLTLIFVFSILFSISWEILANNKSGNFEGVLEKIFSTIFIIFYIPFLLTFITKLTVLNYSREFLILFFLIVFSCDSFAWLFGVLFGKGTRGIITVSPKKSLVGFIGGIISSIAITFLFCKFYPTIFNSNYVAIFIIGFFTAISAILGDLAESAIKRSASVKDSGTIMPGRGGLLDSIDSILFAAPIYYILILFFFV
ncbi:MAG: hypothetical protein BKP49_01550 [Treponema sp. CETP13]|nr:MAG: hypothetical protein BKP49_01550 [Treponema sp. CETP13]